MQFDTDTVKKNRLVLCFMVETTLDEEKIRRRVDAFFIFKRP